MAAISPTLKVTLRNPDVVARLFELGGDFASICKLEDGCVLSANRKKSIGRHCLSSQHFSPFRHIYIEFTIEGVSRVCTHQLVRHSVGVAINQLSGVFTETSAESGNFYIIPPTVAKLLADKEGNKTELGNELDSLLGSIESFTKKLRDAGIPNSDARYFVPNGVNSSLNMAFTIEALFHLCNERLCMKAQWEIRAVAREMAKLVIKANPELKPYLVPKCVKFNGCMEKLPCGYYNAYKNTQLPLNGKVETRPIEQQIKVLRCEKCGASIQFKEDDVPGKLNDGKLTCRQCVEGDTPEVK